MTFHGMLRILRKLHRIAYGFESIAYDGIHEFFLDPPDDDTPVSMIRFNTRTETIDRDDLHWDRHVREDVSIEDATPLFLDAERVLFYTAKKKLRTGSRKRLSDAEITKIVNERLARAA